MLTIENIQNNKRKSGFNHVNEDDGVHPFKARHSAGGAKRTHPASKGGSEVVWVGPRRDTAEAAAQDYCDYVNGKDVTPNPQLKRVERASSTTKVSIKVTDEERELRARLRELEKARLVGRPEYTYLIAEKGSDYGVKVGWSVDPEDRPRQFQTGNPRELVVLGYIDGGKPTESALHQKYIGDNILLEWFRPSRELFEEFGVDYGAWRESLQGQIEAPESIAA